MAASKKRIVFGIAVFVGAALFAAAIYLLISATPRLRRTPVRVEPAKPLTVSGTTTARSAYRFVESLALRSETFTATGLRKPYYRPGEPPPAPPERPYDGSALAATLKRYGKGVSSLDTESSSPHAISAWRMLAHAAMFQLTGETTFADRALVNYLALMFSGNSVEQGNVLHELFEAGRILNNEQMLSMFWQRAVERKAQLAALNKQAFAAVPPPVLATDARQFAQAARLLSESAQYPNMPADAAARKALKDDFVSLSRRFLLAADEAGNQSGLEPIVPRAAQAHQYSCFVNWARMALFEAAADPKDLDEAVIFFRTVNFRRQDARNVRFATLHAAVACVHALQELRRHRQEFAADFSWVLENVVLPNWDYEQRRLCDGDNGFFSDLNWPAKQASVCDENVKAATDAAWLVFLLSKETGEFAVK